MENQQKKTERHGLLESKIYAYKYYYNLSYIQNEASRMITLSPWEAIGGRERRSRPVASNVASSVASIYNLKRKTSYS